VIRLDGDLSLREQLTRIELSLREQLTRIEQFGAAP